MAGVFEFLGRRNYPKSSLLRRSVRFLSDLAALTFVIILAVIVKCLKPKRGGFTCHDPDLSYPNVKDTVPMSVLLVFSTLVPFTIFYVVELNSESHRVRRSYIRLSLTQVVRMTCIFGYGLCVTIVFSGCGQLLSGELRPNFFRLCVPNVTSCRAGQFITEYECTGTNSDVEEVFRGFPSLHASCSAYAMVFVALYLQARLHITFCTLLRPLLQAAGLCVAYYLALTRVSDYKHRWSDCVVGSLIGTLAAVYTAFRVAKLFVVKHIPTTSTLASLSDSEYEEREQFLMQTVHSDSTTMTGSRQNSDKSK